jgi:hypothetical protein
MWRGRVYLMVTNEAYTIIARTAEAAQNLCARCCGAARKEGELCV